MKLLWLCVIWTFLSRKFQLLVPLREAPYNCSCSVIFLRTLLKLFPNRSLKNYRDGAETLTRHFTFVVVVYVYLRLLLRVAILTTLGTKCSVSYIGILIQPGMKELTDEIGKVPYRETAFLF